MRLGDETVDLARHVVIVGPDDRALSDQIVAAGVSNLGPVSVEALDRLPGAGSPPAMMEFSDDQLPELAVAVVRGLRIVHVHDTAAAAKVCRMVEALVEAERAWIRRR